MSRLYEMMFVMDNNAVRASWTETKATVAALIEKHGGQVRSSRRWGERRLAYPIKRRRRGTFLLAYGAFDPQQVSGLRRELDLSETVLRYLVLQAEEVPQQELDLTQAESEAGFAVPEPPSDDVVEDFDESAAEEATEEAEASDDDGSDDDKED